MGLTQGLGMLYPLRGIGILFEKITCQKPATAGANPTAVVKVAGCASRDPGR